DRAVTALRSTLSLHDALPILLEHMKNYCEYRLYIDKLFLPNLKRRYAIHNTRITDPFQYRRIPLETLQNHQKKRAEDTWGTVKRLTKYLLQYKWMLVLIISMVILSSAMALLGPYL